MFNDFFIIQFVIVLIIYFFLLIGNLLSFIFNSIIFLIAMSLYLWLNDSDVFVNFLLIIDLGVFFVLLSFLVSISNFFKNFSFYRSKGLFFIILLPLLFFVWFTIIPTTLVLKSTSVSYLTLNYYNWVNLLSLTYFTDLQLWAELYYFYSIFEFIMMNFYLYLAILFVFLLFYLINTVAISPSVLSNLKDNLSDLQFFNYLRVQDFQKQKNQKASVRVWFKR